MCYICAHRPFYSSTSVVTVFSVSVLYPLLVRLTSVEGPVDQFTKGILPDKTYDEQTQNGYEQKDNGYNGNVPNVKRINAY